ncbi:TetR/AcrR family transcriptional regulator C-terminal domain-containing protein [Actinomadura sp. NBRC 104425]|uniref:TetR/AcrR family transcriptional regulator C-terminal domain-containing protein n=1 Tax=Actinomadura sp. NBRC 104425 TaxID=3032204 RepID=UPI0025564E5C|nr:TetR/AcrR family transcriptional regulator C-terminal domain-containing protein [Actinomadura sp. NBRC 104425]
MIGILREAGLDDRDAVWAVDALTYYVVGHAAEEQLAAATPQPAAERLTGALDPDAPPAHAGRGGPPGRAAPEEHCT